MASNKIDFNPLTGNFDLVRTDELGSGTFSAANNQASPADVTGLSFGNQAASVQLFARLDATSNDYLIYNLEIYPIDGDYVIVQSQSGPNTLNIDFTVTVGGQVQYTSDNYAGFSTLDFTWKSLQIA